MIRYLDKHQVAEIIGVPVKTAAAMMMEMNPIAISGKVRKRYRVTEASLEQFMLKRMLGKPKTGSAGSNKRLARR